MPRKLFLLVLLLLTLPSTLRALDPDLLAGLRARSIGPAGMSGRVTSIAAVEANPSIVFIGGATGGVWKSTDGAITWTPLFDDQPVASIGAIAIFQPNPDVVWVGTGEGNTRNSMSVGNGIPLARWRQELGSPGAGEDGADLPHRNPPDRSQHRVGLGPRPGLG